MVKLSAIGLSPETVRGMTAYDVLELSDLEKFSDTKEERTPLLPSQEEHDLSSQTSTPKKFQYSQADLTEMSKAAELKKRNSINKQLSAIKPLFSGIKSKGSPVDIVRYNAAVARARKMGLTVGDKPDFVKDNNLLS